MDKLQEIAETLKSNVRLMIDSPQELIFECVPFEGGATVRIAVAASDFGKIIGKQGANARALRTLAVAMGMAAKLRISLDIVE